MSDIPSGLPAEDDEHEETPLGVDEDPATEPEQTGEEAMPGIPTEGEPPAAS